MLNNNYIKFSFVEVQCFCTLIINLHGISIKLNSIIKYHVITKLLIGMIESLKIQTYVQIESFVTINSCGVSTKLYRHKLLL